DLISGGFPCRLQANLVENPVAAHRFVIPLGQIVDPQVVGVFGASAEGENTPGGHRGDHEDRQPQGGGPLHRPGNSCSKRSYASTMEATIRWRTTSRLDSSTKAMPSMPARILRTTISPDCCWEG